MSVQDCYPRPITPDSIAGSPTFRTSQARQVDVNRITEEPQTEPPQRKRRYRFRWGVLAALLFVMLSSYVIWNSYVVPLWGSVLDQWNYGSTRITQMDANVGHGGTSHFIAEYYKGAIVVIEIPLSHPADAHTYTLTGMGGGTSSTVLLLSVQSGAIPGKPNLVIQVEGSTLQLTLYNTGTAFQREEGQA